MKRKDMPQTSTAHIAEQAEKIARTHVVIQDLDDHLANNNLEEGEKLVFRLLRNSYVDGIRFDLRLEPLSKHAVECQKNPSLIYSFRNDTGKTIGIVSTLLIGSYVFLRVIELLFGLEMLIKPLFP